MVCWMQLFLIEGSEYVFLRGRAIAPDMKIDVQEEVQQFNLGG